MSKINDFNTKLAARITSGVATMWCAYAFAAIALVSLPSALKSGDLITIVAWVAQTFLQLVLLSIIMVGFYWRYVSKDWLWLQVFAVSLNGLSIAGLFLLTETPEYLYS